MRLIKENRLFISICIWVVLAVAGCQYISEKQMLVGRWQYLKVLNNDSILVPLVQTDYLEIRNDSTFHYEISSAHKYMNGTWQYANHQLLLKYTEPDTVRAFEIEIISKRNLIFNEGSKHFELKRLE